MFERHYQFVDRAGAVVLRGCGVVSASVVLLIVGFLMWKAWPAATEIGLLHFVGDTGWHPTEGAFSLVAMALATVAVTLGAVLLAAPLGVASAAFTRFYAPRWVAGVYRRGVEVLAGIPSVVFGFWGLVTLVPLIARWGGGAGASLLAAVCVLTLMILPTIALLSETALGAVSGDSQRGAAALGLGKWAMLRRVLLPAALPGLASAVLLAAMRAVGETMAVLMVAGNVVRLPGNPLAPVRVLTANIALEMGYAYGPHRAALFLSGVLLLGLVAGGVLLADLLGRRERQAVRRG
ncbi:MAG: phosphate ABC transporter permease subunit PstC [Algisphaera sp.]